MGQAERKAMVDQPGEAEWIIANLVETINRCMEHHEVYDNRGQKIPGLFEFDASGATRALELLGKRLGMWGERQPLRAEDLAKLSDEDLYEIRRGKWPKGLRIVNE